MTDKPKDPWGGDSKDESGPRKPWSIPPSGARGRGPRPSALDEFLRRARRGSGGGGGGFPGGRPPAQSLWLAGIGILVAIWVVLTSVHPIGPQQRGVVTFFGRYVGLLDPGFQLTFPAPIEMVSKIDVQAIRTLDFPENGGENLMLTGDRNVVDLGYSVRWDISNPEDYAFQLKNPIDTVKATAESAMRAVLANTTLNQAIGSGRNKIEGSVQIEMQQILDSYHAGVRVQGVAIKQASAPSKLLDAFNSVTAAQSEAVSNKNQASTYAQQKIALAEGDAAEFDRFYAQYKLAPEVTKRRLYYETMESVLSRNNKTIIEGGSNVVPYLQLPNMRKLPDAPAQGQAQGDGQ